MADDDGLLDFEKPRRAALAGKKQATSVSPKDVLSIISGRLNEKPADSGVVKKIPVNEKPSVIPTHKMEMCLVCGKIGPRIRFLTLQRNVCSRACEGERNNITVNPIPWVDRDLRLPERSLRRRGVVGSFRWQDATTGGRDLKAAPVHCFPHAPAVALWRRVTLACSTLPSQLVVETELPAGDAPATALWIARVTTIRGYMARLRYEGVDDPKREFWVNLASQTYPLGWAAANGRPLVPPKAVIWSHDDEGWRDFLSTRLRGCQTLPWDFVQQLTETRVSRFKPGMYMELVDKDLISQVRLAQVEKVAACRLHMRYVGADVDDPGFVCHQDSPLIHSVGWAHRVGAIVSAPTEYMARCELNSFLPEDSGPELFVQPAPFEPSPGQRIVTGMKLEAIDPLNLSAICVGTVAKVLGEGYLMVRIESYDEEEDGSRADWFCYHAASPSIFRVGFCQRNNLRLVPPKGFPGAVFTWERYLELSGAKAAPLPPHEPLAHGFAPGHRLEAADLMDPRKVCAASVAQVVGRLLRVHFDGWGSEYDQWMDAESPDIYPVGWCEMVGHRLEPPRATAAPSRNLGVVVNISHRRPLPSDSDFDPDALPVLSPVSPVKSSPGPVNPPRLRAVTGRRRKPTGGGPEAKTEVNSEDSDDGSEKSESTGKREEKATKSPEAVHQSEGSSPQMKAPRRISRAPARFLRSSMPAQGKAKSPEPRARSAEGHTLRTRATKQGGKEPNTKIKEKKAIKATKFGGKVQEEPQFGSSDEDKPLVFRLGRKQPGESSSPPGRKRVAEASFEEPRAKTSNATSDRTKGGLRLPRLADADPRLWSEKDVAAFLQANDCGAFASAFLLQEIDGPTFLTMTDNNIILLTSTKVGPALLIADLLQRLKTFCQQRVRGGRQ